MTRKRSPRVPGEGTRTIERPDGTIEVQQLEVDPVTMLMSEDKPHARVSVNVSYSYQPFAPGKVSVHITLECDQDTNTIDRAVHLARRMAREYAIDGMELIREDVESGRFVLPEESRA